jgi:2-keto-4-pentenoate hydratase/2-oxohepta-3-ene-1,7-dioic acid hydratase in catechol pathway
MQSARTDQMMFPVAVLIEELSKGTTLAPGTMILTGTPSGVGMARNPQVWLNDGDVIEVEIEGIGVLKNQVRFG